MNIIEELYLFYINMLFIKLNSDQMFDNSAKSSMEIQQIELEKYRNAIEILSNKIRMGEKMKIEEQIYYLFLDYLKQEDDIKFRNHWWLINDKEAEKEIENARILLKKQIAKAVDVHIKIGGK